MPILVEIGADQQLDQPVIRACCDQPLCARPVHAVDASYVMVLLLKHHVNLLHTRALIVVESPAAVDLVFVLLTITAVRELGKGADLERLRVGAKDEVVSTRAETTCSDRLVVP